MMRRTSTSDIWGTLFDLMAQLPAMGDLHYLVEEELHPALLEVLSAKEKACNLHLHVRHLYNVEGSPPAPDALAFLRSPHLHTVYGGSYSLVTGSTEPLPALLLNFQDVPNLKELHLDVSNPVSRTGHQPQQPFNLSITSPIRSLVMDYKSPSISEQNPSGVDRWLESWTSNAALAHLEDLKLEKQASSSTTWVLANSYFPRLTNVRLACSAHDNIEYYTDVKRFIERLRRLANLGLMKWDFKRLGLADCLGSSLTTLKLVNFREDYDFEAHGWGSSLSEVCFRLHNNNLCETEISQIAGSCPEITELHIQFHRSMGDAAEVRIYKILGGMPKLRHLILGLSASPRSVVKVHSGSLDTGVEPHFDGSDDEYMPGRHPYRKGHYQDYFVNSPIDDKLAICIFQAISSGKGLDSVPLETLSVRSCEAHHLMARYKQHRNKDVHDDVFLNVMRAGCPIVVTRDIRFDH